MDLFFYGSQDVPPPPHPRCERLPRRGDGTPAVCESCSAPVAPDDLRDGRATEIYGLVLCETCRLKARAEERVELYFCDRCQVSVPVYRVDTGEALAGDGRILCLDCRRRPNRRLSTVVVVVLLFAAFAFGAWLGRDRGASAAGPDPVELRWRRELLDRVERAGRRLPEIEELESRVEQLAAIRRGLADYGESARVTSETLDLARTVLEETRTDFLRRVEQFEGGILSLLRNTEAALVTAATAER